MKRILFFAFGFLLMVRVSFSAPSNSISIPNSFNPNTTISSSETNTNNNEIQTKYNAHTHSDLTSFGVVTTGVWQATTIGTTYGGTGATAAANAAGGVVVPTGAVNAANGAAVLGTDGYLPDASCDTTALKTTTGEVSVTDGGQILTLPGGEYGFYPQIKVTGGTLTIADLGSGTSDTSYATLTHLTITTFTAYAKQRYVTASGEDMWIFLLLDKTTKEIISAYSAPDHPAYGNSGDFDKMPHPFGSYDETKHEIVLLDKDTCFALKTESEQTGKSILTLINEEYEPNMGKEEAYQPLHSGRFIDKKPELVKTIPAYIKVRKLTELSDQEKTRKKVKTTQPN